MELSIAPVRQQVAAARIESVQGAVRKGLGELPLSAHVQPGMQIAIALGSRGISCLPEVVKTLISELLDLGAHPFLVPAMGSHGGGTAAGQQSILEGYGLSQAATGIPIRSSMQVVQAGSTPDGMPVFIDANAAQADGIILVNRIKEHTAFKAAWESGLMKILAVGLGKARGADEIHSHGVAEAMPAAARVLLEKMPVLAGVGIVENGRHEPVRIAVLPAGQIEAQEPALLNLARQQLPRIPLEPLDLLVLQEMGKDISGTGIDLNVVGMWRRTGGPVIPRIEAIGVLDLTENSHGNAIGVGHADFITRRLYEKIDLNATYLNCLTSRNFAGAKIPITLEDDRRLFETALSGKRPDQARWVIAKNTLELENFWVSARLLPEVNAQANLEQIGELLPLKFDSQGCLQLPAAS